MTNPQEIREFDIFSATETELRDHIRRLLEMQRSMTNVSWSMNECNARIELASAQLNSIENGRLAKLAIYISVPGIVISTIVSIIALV